jgi:hypothetical protein
MYLRPAEVHRLVDRIGARFPGGGLLFDTVPRWFSARTVAGRMRTAQGYRLLVPLSARLPVLRDVRPVVLFGRFGGA